MAFYSEKFTRDIRSLFENAKSNCLLFLDQKGNIEYINQAFSENFGYTFEELRGVNFKILFTEADQHKKKPQKEIESVLKKGHGADNNYLVAKNGALIWVAGESLLMQDSGTTHILKIVQNINTHKKSELDCIELNEFNENILASMDDAVFVLDCHKKLLKYNLPFKILFKNLPEPFSYPKLIQFLKTLDPARDLENRIEKLICDGGSFNNFPLNFPRSPKGHNSYIVNGNRLVQSNKKDRFLVIIHDITQLKELENEREDVMAFVGHELRSPLANLSLCVELLSHLLNKGEIEKTKEILNKSTKNIQLLHRMIAELNTSTKIQAGNMELNKTTFNFNVMVSEVKETHKALHPAFSFTENEVSKIQITADKFRLAEVISNYLNNAIKYSSGSTQIILSTSLKNSHLIFSIRDHGPGISKEELPFIFNRFFRAERTKNLEGIGLGLYLCEKIIKAHGGKVWVESEPGRGSEFYFSIPLSN